VGRGLEETKPFLILRLPGALIIKALAAVYLLRPTLDKEFFTALKGWRLELQRGFLRYKLSRYFKNKARGHAGSGVAIKGLSLSRKHCLAIEGKAARWYK